MGKDVTPEGVIDFFGYLAALLFMMWMIWAPIFVFGTVALSMILDAKFEKIALHMQWVALVIELVLMYFCWRKMNVKVAP